MSVKDITDESNLARNCTLRLFVGDKLGSGSFRNVYAMIGDKSKVIKVEYSGRDFCNVHEMAVWKKVEATPIEHWFAPCHQIDLVGISMIQSRTVPFECEADFIAAVKATPTKKIPGFFDDVHFGNFGMLEGRIVCHDYGFTHFLEQGVEAGWRAQQLNEEKAVKRIKGKKK